MDDSEDVLNLARLEEAYEDDRAAIAELLLLACETESRYIHALHEALAQADSAGVASAAHSIKGSASNIGAIALSRTAAQIETFARRNESAAIPALAEELDQRYATLRTHVAAYSASAHD